ncbi:MAG: hypothetical protein WA839_14985, partial [Flavobacteriaceae bacterium]
EKATLKIKITDKDNNPIIAHLGLSIFDRSYKNKLEQKNILSHYYLSTQLKGNIYNPNYYFDEENKNRLEALNLLLLTQGWRCYIWDENNIKELRKPLLSDSIIGKVYLERITKKSETEGLKVVRVFTSDSLKGKDFIMTDSKGFFSIDYKHLKMGEKGYVYLKSMTSEKPKYVINIKDASFDIINANRKTIPINYPLLKLKEEPIEDNRAPLIVSDKVNKLEEVVLSIKKKKVFRDKYLGVLDSLAKIDLATDFVCLNHITPVLNCFRKDNQQKRRPAIDGETVIVSLGKNGEILGADYPHDYYFGDRIITYRNANQNLTEEELLKKFNLRMIKGYYGKREFYKPMYDVETVNDPFPDYRNTLYWKPDIITNEQGEAIIEFYCSDINTIFSGTIEGVSNNELLGSKNFEFKVIKRE